MELGPDTAIFVPRGVGNSFQTLEENTAYTYLVNDHWSADAVSGYSFLNLADETVAIDWPIDLAKAELSEKDRNHPRLNEIKPLEADPILIIGAGGQLGTELVRQLTEQNVPSWLWIATASTWASPSSGATHSAGAPSARSSTLQRTPQWIRQKPRGSPRRLGG